MQYIGEIFCGILLIVFVYIVVVGDFAQKMAVRRDRDRIDWNYDPATNEADLKVYGGSLYRLNAREGNIWWNKQHLSRLEITSFDGLKLVGNLLYAKEPNKRVLLSIHGHRCVSGEMGFISRMYYEHGFNVFAPDQRAHGKSEGTYIGMGFFERKDMLSWIDRIIEIFGDDCEIVLHGISMGAATVMMTAGEPGLQKNVVCAVEDCGYTDAYGSLLFHAKRDMKRMPLKVPVIFAAGIINRLRAGYDFRECEAITPLSRASIPMLFIHGTHDDVVPFDMLKTLYDAHGGEKKMLVVEGAPHGVSYFHDPQVYEQAVFSFVDSCLKTPANV